MRKALVESARMTNSPQFPSTPAEDALAVLQEGFALWRRSIVTCLPLALCAVLAGQVPAWSGAASSSQPLGFLLTCGMSALGLWLLAVIGLRQAAIAAGRTERWSASVRTARDRMPRLVLVVLAQFAFVLVGLALLVVPGVYLFVALWPAFYLVLLERRGLRESLDLALRLVRHRWWQVAGVAALVAIAVLVLFVIDVAVNVVLTQLLGHLPDARLSSALSVAVGALFQPFCIAVGLVEFRFLRRASPPGIPAAADR